MKNIETKSIPSTEENFGKIKDKSLTKDMKMEFKEDIRNQQ